MCISNIIATSCPKAKGLQSSSPSPYTQRRWCRMSNLPFRVPELAMLKGNLSCISSIVSHIYQEGFSFCIALHCCIAAGLQTANATKRQFCLNPSNLTRCGSANATSCCFSPFNRQINCHSILNRQTSNFELNERSMYNNDNGKQEVQQRRCMGIIRVL